MYNATPIQGGASRYRFSPGYEPVLAALPVAQRRILSRCKDERSGASTKRLIAGVARSWPDSNGHGAGDPAAGEQNAAVCAGCHGQGGAKPVMAVYPGCPVSASVTHTALVDIKNGDRPIPEMTGLLDAMSTRTSGPQPISTSRTWWLPADPSWWNRVGPVPWRQHGFRVPACSGCHNPRGTGNEPVLSGTEWPDSRVRCQAAECLPFRERAGVPTQPSRWMWPPS